MLLFITLVTIDSCLFSGGARSQPKAVAGKAAPLSRTQRTQGQPSSKNAADRVTKRLVHSARAGARQGSSSHPPLDTTAPAAAAAASSSASDTAASALKQASVAGNLGCPKCRQAVYGCKKCRAAYVRTTGISIPIDRSLHADLFSMLQHQSASSPSAAKSSQLVPGQEPSSAGTVESASQEKQGDRAGKAVYTERGNAAPAAMSKRQLGVAHGQKISTSGQKASADRKSLSADRPGSAKSTNPETLVQQPAHKKPKAAATPDAIAAANTGARVSSRAASGSKKLQPGSSPDVRRPHAESPPPPAKRSRLSQTPKVPAAAKAPGLHHSTAVKGLSPKLSTVGKAVAAFGDKPGSIGKSASQAVRLSSSSARRSSAIAKQPRTAVKASVPAALARSPTEPTAGKSIAAALPKQAASAFKQACKPTLAAPKSNRKGSGTGMKASSSSPAPALPAQAAAKARSVASPKAIPAAKLRQTLPSRAAAAAGSVLVQGLDSNLGCSKCRFVPTGCKRCRAKQAGHKNLGTQA